MLVKINNCKLISELVPNKSILNKRIYFGYNYMYKKSETFILSISSMILTSRNGAWDNTSEDGCEMTPKTSMPTENIINNHSTVQPHSSKVLFVVLIS